MFIATSNFLIPNATLIVELVAFLVVLAFIGKYVLPYLKKALDERTVGRVGLLAQITLEEEDGALGICEHAMALPDVEEERWRREGLVGLAVELERLVEVTDVVFDRRTTDQGLGLLEWGLCTRRRRQRQNRRKHDQASCDAEAAARSRHRHSNGLMTPDESNVEEAGAAFFA